MRKLTLVVMITLLFSVLALAVMSQLQITSSISITEHEICTSESYKVLESRYEDCSYTESITTCLNTSGPNTDCSTIGEFIQQECYVGKQAVTKERTVCTPDNIFTIKIDNGFSADKKQLDSSSFGPCGYEEQGDCLLITCVSEHDGAHNGEFVGCSSGMSCQKFEICGGSIKQYFHTHDKFVEDGESFKWSKLSLAEVKQ